MWRPQPGAPSSLSSLGPAGVRSLVVERPVAHSAKPFFGPRARQRTGVGARAWIAATVRGPPVGDGRPARSSSPHAAGKLGVS